MRVLTGLLEGVWKGLLCVGNVCEGGRGGSWSSSEAQKGFHEVAGHPKSGGSRGSQMGRTGIGMACDGSVSVKQAL